MAATPTYQLTQFTPSPSCGIGSDLWAVSKTCLMTGGIGSPTTSVIPGPLPWVSCTAVQMGEPPDRGNADCYLGYRSITRGDDSRVYISACPVGYDTASIVTHHPFYRSTRASQSSNGEDHRATATDVVANIIYCCPSASGFGFHMSFDKLEAFTTDHDGTTYRGYTALMPMCVATSVEALSSGQAVTLTPYSDTRAWEKRQEKTADGLLTELWDPRKKVWAEAESFSNTVFGDGHTCYDGGHSFGAGPCTEYWMKHYTSPEVVPTPPTTSQGSAATTSSGSGTPSTTSQGNAGISSSGNGTLAGAATSTTSTTGVGTSRTPVKGHLVGVAVLILALGAVMY